MLRPMLPAPWRRLATTVIAAPKGPGLTWKMRHAPAWPGDTTPAGTVQDGMRKVVTKSPFCDVCRWETAK